MYLLRPSFVPLFFSSTSLLIFSYVDPSEGKREYVGINFIEVSSVLVQLMLPAK